MNEMISKINELETKIASQARQEVQVKLSSEPPAERPRERPHVVAEVKQQYSPSDVSVDKIFYAGK